MKIASVFGAAMLLAGVSTVAMAADLPSRKSAAPVYAAPMFTWTGFYVGVNAGGVIANTLGVANGITPNIAVLAPFLPSLSTSNFGFIGGGQVGFNWQTGSFVFGVEADIDGATAKGTRTVVVSSIFGPVVGNAQAKLDWLATVRGRIGYTITPNLLGYVTGGLAIGGGPVSGGASLFPFTWAGSSPATRTGWTVGAGAEYALTNNFSVKGEYLYYNLGSSQLIANEFLLPSAVTYNVKRDGHVFRLGVNYRFGGGSTAVVAKY